MTSVISADGHIGEVFLIDAVLEIPRRQQAAQSRGIDEVIEFQTPLVPILPLPCQRRRPLSVQRDVRHADFFEDVRPLLGGMIQHDFVELGTNHLVAVIVPASVPREVDVTGFEIVLDLEIRAVFLDEPLFLDLFADAQEIENVPSRQQQRLADVIARKTILLQDDDVDTLTGQQDRHGRPRGSAADHRNTATSGNLGC